MWQLRFNNLQVVTIAFSLIYFSLHVLPIHAKMEEPASRITRKIVMIVSVEKVSWGTIAREVTLKRLFSFSFENLNLLFLWSSCIFSGFTSIHLLSYFPYSCYDMTFMFYLNSLYLFPLLIAKSGWLVFLLVASPLHVTKIKEIITNLTSSSMSNKFSFPVP